MNRKSAGMMCRIGIGGRFIRNMLWMYKPSRERCPVNSKDKYHLVIRSETTTHARKRQESKLYLPLRTEYEFRVIPSQTWRMRQPNELISALPGETTCINSVFRPARSRRRFGGVKLGFECSRHQRSTADCSFAVTFDLTELGYPTVN